MQKAFIKVFSAVQHLGFCKIVNSYLLLVLQDNSENFYIVNHEIVHDRSKSWVGPSGMDFRGLRWCSEGRGENQCWSPRSIHILAPFVQLVYASSDFSHINQGPPAFWRHSLLNKTGRNGIQILMLPTARISCPRRSEQPHLNF